jgi:hypothetical protein
MRQAIRSRLALTWSVAKPQLMELFLALDQLLNPLVLGFIAVLLTLATGRRHAVNYADETLSAHAYRARVAGKWMGKLWEPVIDVLFAWQKPDPTIAPHGVPITKHCERAYWKERQRRGLPIEYRDQVATTSSLQE